MKLKTIIIVSTSLLMAACAAPKYNSVAYMSLEVPKDTIRTKPNVETSTETTSRTSIGVYRPPVEVSGMLDAGKVYRDVDVILQTPVCVFPIICMGTDKLMKVAQEDMR